MSTGYTSKTSLFANFQGGSLQISDINLFPGRVLYVNNSVTAAANDAFHGWSPLAPLSTLAYAMSTVAQDLDVFLVGSGHVETIAGAAGVNVSKNGVHIIGTSCGGTGTAVVKFITSTGASFDVNGSNCCIENLFFDSVNTAYTGVMDANAANVLVKAAGLTIRSCYFSLANATNQATYGIVTNASSGFGRILNCFFTGSADAGTTAAIKLVGGNNMVVAGNYFNGAYTSGVGAIQGLTTDGVDYQILNNVIINATGGATKGCVFTAATTGMVANNRFGIGSGTAPITGLAMWRAGNYSAAAANADGTLV